MMEWKDLMDLTNARMSDPQVGDLFHEMYCYWVEITARDGESLNTREGTSDWHKPTIVHYGTVDEFQKKFAYTTQFGYSIVYYDRPPQGNHARTNSEALRGHKRDDSVVGSSQPEQNDFHGVNL